MRLPPSFAGLRGRLLLFVLLSALPALGLILYSTVERRKHELEEARETAQRLVRLVARNHAQLFAGVRQLLVTLAQLPEVRGIDRARCSGTLEKLARQHQGYTKLAVAAPGGELVCCSLPLTAPVSVADRGWFRRAVASRDFSAGEYEVGAVSGKPVLVFAYPVADEAGELRAVVAAGVDLSWLAHLGALGAMPQGAVVTLRDRNGTILLRDPDPEKWVGKAFADAPLLESMRAEGTAELTGIDGVTRLYAFARVEAAPEAALFLSIGIPREIALAEADRVLRLNLLWLAVVLALMLATAWVGSSAFILRPVTALLAAAGRLEAGDLAARTGLPHGHGELDRLAAAFDEMAASLQGHEAERMRADEALRASEERFRAVAQSANEAIIVADAHGRIVLWNAGAERLFLHTVEEALGQPVTILMPEPYLSRHREAVARLLATGEPRVIRTPYEVRGLRKDGSEVDVEVSLARWEASGDMSYAAIIRDIGERKRLQAQLLQAQKMEAVGTLAGGVAHDFNNILQAMLSHLELLRAHGDDPGRVAASVDELAQQVARGAAVSRQLLLFSRRETAKPECLDLNELIQGAVRLLRRLVRENVVFALELADAPLAVRADRRQLEQALMNLVLNASDAMPDGGRLTIGTGTASEGRVWLAVGDTGHGIPEEIRGHLFEPFFTTKGEGKGTGLGLAVVHGIVAQHGGRIEVESSVGEGSTFRIVLPGAAPGERPQVPGAAAPQELARGHGERILVVEDEQGAREAIKEILTSLGYDVVVAGSGEEAGTLPEQPAFQALLTDLLLPGVSGVELARGLQERWPGLKVILMSGYTDEEVLRHGVKLGQVRFLQKPFDMDTLARELRAALGD